jgi:hypothetical protein
MSLRCPNRARGALIFVICLTVEPARAQHQHGQSPAFRYPNGKD